MRRLCTVVIYDRQIDTIGQELAAQKEPFKPIATPITVGGFRFDDEKPLKDGESGCNFRYFLTADKATILWNRTMKWARGPYADEPEASTQAPDSTGNGAKKDKQTKALGSPPETGEGAFQSTQHDSTETPHGKSTKGSTAAAGPSEEPTKAELLEEEEVIYFTDAIGRHFDCPLYLCNTWAGMKCVIQTMFLHVKELRPDLTKCHYDLVGPTGEIILPEVWESVVEPGWTITMQLWPPGSQDLPAKTKTRETEAGVEESKGTKPNFREAVENFFGREEDDSEPRGRSPPASLRATSARRPVTPTIVIDLEEGTGESSSKPDQDKSKMQLPIASEHGGEEGSIEGGVELELRQIPPRQPSNLFEESLLRSDSGIEMD
ncbi:MAG: hypothetical protein L6R42_009143 [Xanthoria sp. 1 TBL-2021]|nr:MAG: hypothetical protein L6R42_009143 [Xanthoria sp. 1 TBL-2021]